jgi:hypothetical protein
MFRSSLRFASLAIVTLSMVGCAAQTDAAQQDDTAAESDLTSKPAHFDTFDGADGLHYFDLRAGNNQVLLSSEGYSSKAAALSGIASVQASGRSTTNYQTYQASSTHYGVDLTGGNGQVIAEGQVYASKASATRAINRIATILSRRVDIIAK